MNNPEDSFPKLREALSKQVCLRCMEQWRDSFYSLGSSARELNLLDLACKITEDSWKRGITSCHLDTGGKARSIYAPPPDGCPHLFEHGVALAWESICE